MGRKTTEWTFQATSQILDMAKKGKLYERNWISSDSSTKQRHKDYVKAKIDKTQQNSRYGLCSDWDETINSIIIVV